MFQNLAIYFYENLVASYDAYVRERDADSSGRYRHLRTAVQCSSVLFHFREHLTAPHTMTWLEVYRECPDYRLIANIANTTKHSNLTKNDPIGVPLVARTEDLSEVRVIVRYEDEHGDYSDSRTVVWAQCCDGVERDVDVALTNVLNFWGAKLEAWGVTKFVARPLPDRPGTRWLSREEIRPGNLEALQGIDFTQQFRLFEWDSDAGVAKPKDITGSKIEFRIYKPSYKFAIGFTHPDHPDKAPIEMEFDLTDEESARVHAANTDAEREAAYRAFADARQDEIRARAVETIGYRRKAVGDDVS